MNSEFPLVDFSDIPGCESPTNSSQGACFRTISSSSTVSKSTKSRISSIFSATSTLDSLDDDPFDLKSSTRKVRPKERAKISTGLLVDFDGLKTDPLDSPLTDWERLKKEAQAIAGEMKENVGERVIDFDEMLKNSPLPLSPLCSDEKNAELLLVASSPNTPPTKLLNFDDEPLLEPKKSMNKDKENKIFKLEDDVFIDDQLAIAIEKSRKPLSNVNNTKPESVDKKPKPMVFSRPSATPLKSKITPLKPVMRTPLMPRQTPIKSSIKPRDSSISNVRTQLSESVPKIRRSSIATKGKNSIHAIVRKYVILKALFFR